MKLSMKLTLQSKILYLFHWNNKMSEIHKTLKYNMAMTKFNKTIKMVHKPNHNQPAKRGCFSFSFPLVFNLPASPKSN